MCPSRSAAAVVVIGAILGANFLQFIGFTKIFYYVALAEDFGTFSYSLRHVLYAAISSGLLLISNSRVIVLYSLVNLILLSVPLLLPGIGLILERVLSVTCPLIVLALAFSIKDRRIFRAIIVLLAAIFYLSFASKANGTLFYQYMADGEFYSLMSGVFYNLYSRIYI